MAILTVSPSVLTSLKPKKRSGRTLTKTYRVPRMESAGRRCWHAM
jgi:hypothetical protein